MSSLQATILIFKLSIEKPQIHSPRLSWSQEKYEKELKDARARELMYAEEAAILDKV